MQNVQQKRSRALAGMAALAASLLVAVTVLAGGTHAYLTSKTDTYVNTFVSGLPDTCELAIQGEKKLEGRALAAGEFSFELYGTDADFEVEAANNPLQVKTNDANGAFTFDAIEYEEAGTHHYVVVEKIPSESDEGYSEYVTYDETQYRVTVAVAEQNGAYVADSRIVAFDPELAASEADTQDGDSPESVSGPVSEDGANAGNENGAADGGQDPGSQGEGQGPEGRTSDYAGTEVDAINFKNKFDSPDPTFVVSGMKALDGRVMVEGEFSFSLYKVDENWQVAAPAEPLQSARNDAAGGFGFSALSFSKTGTYRYVIREDASSPLGGVTYDDEVYRLEVIVSEDEATGMLSANAKMYVQNADGDWAEVAALQPNGQGAIDNPDGKLYVAKDPQNANCAVGFVTFANTYEAAPASYELAGDVDLVGRDMAEGEFLFTVEPETEGAPAPAVASDTNDAQGGFGFGSLEFSEPGEYHYLIRQDASGALEGVAYDGAVHRVVVTVTDDGNGRLVAEAVVWRDGVRVDDGSGVKYVNRYAEPGEGGDGGPDVPPPGDDDGDRPGDGGPSDGGSDAGTIPGGTGSGGALSQTGDATLVLVGALAVAAAAAAVAGVVAFRKTRR